MGPGDLRRAYRGSYKAHSGFGLVTAIVVCHVSNFFRAFFSTQVTAEFPASDPKDNLKRSVRRVRARDFSDFNLVDFILVRD